MIRRLCLVVLTAAALAVGSVGQLTAQMFDQAELLAPGPLPERVFGDANAPVTVIEYASITCHHCQNFHKTTWPDFKAKYVDTGKVRFIIREFPLDNLAMAGFMLARCSGEDKWYPVVDMLYQTGEGWGHAEKPAEALAQAMRQTGMSREAFEACLGDEKIFNGIKQVAERAKKFQVNSTPTFFINGQRHPGALTLKQLDEIIEPLLRNRQM